MAEYTFKDIIIDPEDERVELRKQYYFANNPTELLDIANKGDSRFLSKLQKVCESTAYPFQNLRDVWNSCIVQAKVDEKESKYVPFDFDYFITRKSLIGEFVKASIEEDGEFQGVVTGFQKSTEDDFWCACISGIYMVSSEEFLEDWTFEDGTPCGKEI